MPKFEIDFILNDSNFQTLRFKQKKKNLFSLNFQTLLQK